MATVEELVVRAKPEGVNQTTKEFDNMQGELEETEQQMDDTAGGFGDLANKWKAALGAIVAGLALAVGGLASQVPILGGLMSGLGAVISGLAIQIDQKLRPALQPIVNDLFELGNAIAAGDFQKAAQIFKDWGNALANLNWSQIFTDIVTGIRDFLSTLGGEDGIDFSGLINSILSTLNDIRGKILDKLANLLTPENVRKALEGLSDVIGDIKVGKYFKTFVDDTTNFLTSVDWLGIAAEIIKFIGQGLKKTIKDTDWSKWLKFFVDQTTKFIDNVDWLNVGKDIITGIADGIAAVGKFAVGGAEDIGKWIAGKFEEAIEDAKEWGKDLIQEFIKGIEAEIDKLEKKLGKVEDKISDALSFDLRENDQMAQRWGQDLTEHFAVGMERGAGNILAAAASAAAGISSKLGSGIAALIPSTVAGAAALGGLVDLLGVAALEASGVLDAVRNLGEYVGNQLPQSITDGMLAVSSAFLAPLAVIGAGIKGFVSGTLEGGLEAGVDRAVRNVRQVLGIFASAWQRTFNRAKQLIGDFVSGVVNGVSKVASGLGEIAGGVTSEFMALVNRAKEWGKELNQQFINGIKSKIDDLSGTLDNVGSEISSSLSVDIGGSLGDNGDTNTPRSVRGGSGGTQVFIDGRDITNETGRYRRDATSRRGRNG